MDRLKVAAILMGNYEIVEKRELFNKELRVKYNNKKFDLLDTDGIAEFHADSIDFTNETIGEGWYKEADITDIKQGLLGCYVIVRTYSAGVHSGFIAAYDDNQNVILRNARRLHLIENLVKTDSISSVTMHGAHVDSHINDEETAIQLKFIELNVCTKGASATLINSNTITE